jgi:hypothetical protein
MDQWIPGLRQEAHPGMTEAVMTTPHKKKGPLE